MIMLIVSFEDRPFAYVQHYQTDAWPQPHFAHLPAGSRAIDAFVGEPDMLGKGHGSVFLQLLAAELKAEGAPVVAIDIPTLREPAGAARSMDGRSFVGETVVETG